MLSGFWRLEDFAALVDFVCWGRGTSLYKTRSIVPSPWSTSFNTVRGLVSTQRIVSSPHLVVCLTVRCVSRISHSLFSPTQHWRSHLATCVKDWVSATRTSLNTVRGLVSTQRIVSSPHLVVCLTVRCVSRISHSLFSPTQHWRSHLATCVKDWVSATRTSLNTVRGLVSTQRIVSSPHLVVCLTVRCVSRISHSLFSPTQHWRSHLATCVKDWVSATRTSLNTVRGLVSTQRIVSSPHLVVCLTVRCVSRISHSLFSPTQHWRSHLATCVKDWVSATRTSLNTVRGLVSTQRIVSSPHLVVCLTVRCVSRISHSLFSPTQHWRSHLATCVKDWVSATRTSLNTVRGLVSTQRIVSSPHLVVCLTVRCVSRISHSLFSPTQHWRSHLATCVKDWVSATRTSLNTVRGLVSTQRIVSSPHLVVCLTVRCVSRISHSLFSPTQRWRSHLATCVKDWVSATRTSLNTVRGLVSTQRIVSSPHLVVCLTVRCVSRISHSLFSPTQHWRSHLATCVKDWVSATRTSLNTVRGLVSTQRIVSSPHLVVCLTVRCVSRISHSLFSPTQRWRSHLATCVKDWVSATCTSLNTVRGLVSTQRIVSSPHLVVCLTVRCVSRISHSLFSPTQHWRSHLATCVKDWVSATRTSLNTVRGLVSTQRIVSSPHLVVCLTVRCVSRISHSLFSPTQHWRSHLATCVKDWVSATRTSLNTVRGLVSTQRIVSSPHLVVCLTVRCVSRISHSLFSPTQHWRSHLATCVKDWVSATRTSLNTVRGLVSTQRIVSSPHLVVCLTVRCVSRISHSLFSPTQHWRSHLATCVKDWVSATCTSLNTVRGLVSTQRIVSSPHLVVCLTVRCVSRISHSLFSPTQHWHSHLATCVKDWVSATCTSLNTVRGLVSTQRIVSSPHLVVCLTVRCVSRISHSLFSPTQHWRSHLATCVKDWVSATRTSLNTVRGLVSTQRIVSSPHLVVCLTVRCVSRISHSLFSPTQHWRSHLATCVKDWVSATRTSLNTVRGLVSTQRIVSSPHLVVCLTVRCVSRISHSLFSPTQHWRSHLATCVKDWVSATRTSLNTVRGLVSTQRIVSSPHLVVCLTVRCVSRISHSLFSPTQHWRSHLATCVKDWVSATCTSLNTVRGLVSTQRIVSSPHLVVCLTVRCVSRISHSLFSPTQHWHSHLATCVKDWVSATCTSLNTVRGLVSTQRIVSLPKFGRLSYLSN